MRRIARIALIAALLTVVTAAYAAEPSPTKTPAKKARAAKPATPPVGEPASKGAPGDTLHRHWGQRPEQQMVTVTGEVIDIFCYLDRGFTGEIHRWCAKTCIKGGMPMGLLDFDGNIWVLTMEHDYGMDKQRITYMKPYRDCEDWAASIVQVTGRLMERKGMKGIEVRGAKLVDQFLPESAESLEVAP